jgi:hypothetical protein
MVPRLRGDDEGKIEVCSNGSAPTEAGGFQGQATPLPPLALNTLPVVKLVPDAASVT